MLLWIQARGTYNQLMNLRWRIGGELDERSEDLNPVDRKGSVVAARKLSSGLGSRVVTEQPTSSRYLRRPRLKREAVRTGDDEERRENRGNSTHRKALLKINHTIQPHLSRLGPLIVVHVVHLITSSLEVVGVAVGLVARVGRCRRRRDRGVRGRAILESMIRGGRREMEGEDSIFGFVVLEICVKDGG